MGHEIVVGVERRAAVAGGDAPEAGHAVQDFLAGAGVEEDAVGAGDDADFALVERFMVGERMQVVGCVQPLPVD